MIIILYLCFDFVGVVSKRYKRFRHPHLAARPSSVIPNDDWLSVVFLEIKAPIEPTSNISHWLNEDT